MAVQLTIEFETLIDLVDQLKPSEKQMLLKHLQDSLSPETLSKDDREWTVPEDSISRTDIYGDDRR